MSQPLAAAVAQHPESSPSLPAIGAVISGGYFVGVIKIDDVKYGLVMAGAAGQLEGRWNSTNRRIEGALSLRDGRENTIDMAAGGSELAERALALSINGFNDWYIPARDELELAYRNAKPSTWGNWEGEGANENSVPPGAPYTKATPTKTTIAELQEGAKDALVPGWYWSSTQYAPNPGGAWGQGFNNGYQSYGRKSYAGRARAVRRFVI